VGVKGAHTKDLLRSFTQGRPPYAQGIAWAEEWRPNLVLIAFGTNDAVDQVGAQYELNFADLLAQIQRTFPSAQIVALGPPAGDLAKMPSLNLVRAMQAQAAGEVHVAWIDRAAIASCQFQADGVHLTANSYRALAEQVAPRLVAVLGK
jgi:lysophospholipase L1-like esterase